MRAAFESVSDAELARESQEGSLHAFEELVYRYEARIYGFLLKSSGNETDARELAQDTFVRAFQAILQFDPRRDFADRFPGLCRSDSGTRQQPHATSPSNSGSMIRKAPLPLTRI